MSVTVPSPNCGWATASPTTYFDAEVIGPVSSATVWSGPDCRVLVLVGDIGEPRVFRRHRGLAVVGSDVGAVGTFLQCFAIDDGDVASAGRDEARLFQRLQGNRNAGTMRAEHE